jgi:hypothetical protein
MVIKIIRFIFIALFCFTYAPAFAVDPPSPSDYEKLILKLDETKVSSIQSALDAYRQNRKPVSSAENDKDFMAFRSLFYGVMDKQDAIAAKVADLMSKHGKLLRSNNGAISDYRFLKKDTELWQSYSNGLDVCESMGEFYISERPGFLADRFSQYVSHSILDYLKIRDKEMPQGFQTDASLEISYRQLAKRVHNWEDYLVKYPDSLLRKEAQDYYSQYLGTLLVGLDNSETFMTQDLSSGADEVPPAKFNMQLIPIYEWYCKKYPTSKTSKIMQQYMIFLKNNNYQLNSSYEPFMKQQGILYTRGLELQTR